MAELFPLKCIECGSLIGVAFKPIHNDTRIFCPLCCHNICQISDAFILPNVPRTQDLIAIQNSATKDHEQAISWRFRIYSWYHDNIETFVKYFS